MSDRLTTVAEKARIAKEHRKYLNLGMFLFVIGGFSAVLGKELEMGIFILPMLICGTVFMCILPEFVEA